MSLQNNGFYLNVFLLKIYFWQLLHNYDVDDGAPKVDYKDTEFHHKSFSPKYFYYKLPVQCIQMGVWIHKDYTVHPAGILWLWLSPGRLLIQSSIVSSTFFGQQ